MKKIISILLCVLITCTASVVGTASAVTDKHIEVVSSKNITIPNNQVRFFTSNLTKDNCYGAVLLCTDEKDITVSVSDCIDKYQTVNTDKNQEYKIAIQYGGSGSRTSNSYSFEKTGGTYEWVRFKIYDFASYKKEFSEDGTSTVTLREDTHVYNFTNEGDGHISTLMIISGGAITVTAPDKDGYVEAYLSTNLGDNVESKTVYYCKTETSRVFDSGSRYNLPGLAEGDVDQNGSIGINDATAIQKYIAEIEELDSASRRVADVNNDENIDVEDVTAIQKYIAGIAY